MFLCEIRKTSHLKLSFVYSQTVLAPCKVDFMGCQWHEGYWEINSYIVTNKYLCHELALGSGITSEVLLGSYFSLKASHPLAVKDWTPRLSAKSAQPFSGDYLYTYPTSLEIKSSFPLPSTYPKTLPHVHRKCTKMFTVALLTSHWVSFF